MYIYISSVYLSVHNHIVQYRHNITVHNHTVQYHHNPQYRELAKPGSDTNCNAPDLTTGSTDQHGSFPACFVLTRTLPGRTSQEVTHPWISPRLARLTLEFLRIGSRKGRCTLLVWIVPIKSFKLNPDLPSPFRCGIVERAQPGGSSTIPPPTLLLHGGEESPPSITHPKDSASPLTHRKRRGRL